MDSNNNLLIEIEPILPENCESDLIELSKSLKHFLKYVDQVERRNYKIFIIPLFNNCFDEKINQEIINLIEQKCKKNSNNTGILFLTMENLARGDYPDSNYNRTRAIREFFERTTSAITANYKNIIMKIYELILKIDSLSSENNSTQGEKSKSTITYSNLGGAIKNWKELTKEIEKIKFEGTDVDLLEISKEYNYQSFHAKTGHSSYRELLKMVKGIIDRNNSELIDENNSNSSVGKTYIECYKKEKLYDISMSISYNPKRLNNLKILVIDDSPDAIRNDLEDIIKFFGENVEIHITAENEWKKFIDPNFWENLYSMDSNKSRLKVYKIGKNSTDDNTIKENESKQNIQIPNNSSQSKNTKKDEKPEVELFNKQKKFIYQYIVVDLLLNGYNRGNRIIRELVKFRTIVNRWKKQHGQPAIFDIIVLSLSRDTIDIQRALDEGALIYILKERIYRLPAYISMLEESRVKIEKIIETPAYKARNFGKLYRLPHVLRRKLQTQDFLPQLRKPDESLSRLAKKLAYNWIRDMPKAELHCHLGGAMDDELVFNLSLNNLYHLANGNSGKIIRIIESYKEEINNKLKDETFKVGEKIQEFYENNIRKIQEIINNSSNSSNEYYETLKEWAMRKLSDEPDNWVNEFKEKFTPEKFFLDFIKFKIEKQGKIAPNNRLTIDDLACLFIVLLGKYEGRTCSDIENFWDKWENILHHNQNNILKKLGIGRTFKEKIKKGLLSKQGKKLSKLYKNITKNIESISNTSLISQILSPAVQGKKRGNIALNLKTYLQGSVFTGSTQLQHYENIVIAVAHILEKASKDNIRYIELRVAPDGYCKKGLSLQEAIQALFDGADLMSFYLYTVKGEFICPNFIFSGKRHKSPDKIAIEIASTIVSREHKVIKEWKRKQKELLIRSKKLENYIYQWQPSKIVGFDLTGIEKTESLDRYANDFLPLFRTCSFITAHAGERNPAEYIWEAVYKLHAHRIGHGLTLREHKFLMELVRDRHICVELCPVSNILTNPRLEKNYPLHKYIQEGLICTLNTDDPTYSGNSTLSNEFVQAAELYNKAEDNFHKNTLTKWEVLRLIKNSFKHAFMRKNEKRQFLRAVEEEIFQKIIQGEGFDPNQ